MIIRLLFLARFLSIPIQQPKTTQMKKILSMAVITLFTASAFATNPSTGTKTKAAPAHAAQAKEKEKAKETPKEKPKTDNKDTKKIKPGKK
jgi:hypothetical protein